MTFTYDKNRLSHLVNNFYVLTKIKAVIYDTDYNTIVSVPPNECLFCETLRKNREFKARCDNCLKKGVIPCRRDNKINIYKCHAGLFEVTSPIRVNGVLFGYFTIGQIIESNDKYTKRSEITEYIKGFTDTDTEQLLNSLNKKDYEQIEAAAEIMNACIAYLLMSDIIKEEKGNIILQLSDYIEENIFSEISVENICREFNISRNSLYKISWDYFGMSVGKYIRDKKIEAAARLLSEGYSVSEVAELTGFCDYNYFSKVFKSVKGVSPGKFKEK